MKAIALIKKRGNDVVAKKNHDILIVEAKGAKAADSSPTKKRDYFDSGQIKKHFGSAIVKLLEQKALNHKYMLAMARPNDPDIRKHTQGIVPFLEDLGIIHFWVDKDGTVTKQYK